MKEITDFVLSGHKNADYLIAIDIESSISCPKGFKGDPLYPDNKIVLIGWRVIKGPGGQGAYRCGSIFSLMNYLNDNLNPEQRDRLCFIGHNIKHDLHLLFRSSFAEDLKKRTVAIWDTMIAQYLLTHHVSKFASLEDTADFYDIKFKKDSSVKDLWDAGVETKDIPMALLEPYLKYDVETCAAIFKAQCARIEANTPEMTKKLYSLISVQMYTLLMVQEMEQNGLPVDVPEIQYRLASLTTQRDGLDTVIAGEAANLLGMSAETFKLAGINASAPRTLSSCLFGKPDIPYKLNERQGDYKNGNPKFRLVSYTSCNPSALANVGDYTDTKYNPKLGYKVDEPCLRLIEQYAPSSSMTSLATAILKRRAIHKQISTYYEPFLEQVALYREPRIHPTIHQCSTDTGRQSSARPNGQNIPPIVKEVIKGDMVEADFSQLEVCALAQLSGDRRLIRDITNGVDIHNEVGTQAGVDVHKSKEIRRKVKSVVFGTVYGGKPHTLSKQSGFPRAVVKGIQDAFFYRYPGLKPYYDRVAEDVRGELRPLTGMSIAGQTPRYGTFTLPTGRTITFVEEASKYRPGELSISMTKIMNRPVQSLATADIVPLFLALLLVYKRFFSDGGEYSLEELRFLMAVHDSALAEGMIRNTKTLVTILAALGEEALPYAYAQWTGEPLLIPLTLDIEFKSNWRE